MVDLKNKVAVITGGSSGIGKGIAEKFYKEGARVAIFGRNIKQLEETQKEISKDILTVSGDVSVTSDQENLFNIVNRTFGKIDVLVANAGVAKFIPIKEASEEEFDAIINTNYKGLFFCIKHSIPFLNKGASIILISSMAAQANFKIHSIYSSGKAAINKLAKNLSTELSDDLIRVNVISPGIIQTPIYKRGIEMNPNLFEDYAKQIPLKRVGQPKDIANAAFFLASEDSSYITGTDILVDGGYTQKTLND